MASPPTTEEPQGLEERPRWTLLSTRVGRRVFLLFVLSALIPVAGMGLVSYRNVSSHIRSLSEQRVKETAKAAGMALIERLMAADGQLLDFMAAGTAERGPASRADRGQSRGGPDQAAAGRFLSRVSVAPWNGGEGLSELGLGAGAIPRMAQGEPQLLLSEGDEGQGFHLLRLDPEGARIYNADLVLDSILAASRIYAETQYGAGICLLTTQGVRVGCDPVIDASFTDPDHPATLDRRGTWMWEVENQDYLGGYWTAFLSASFGAEPLVVAVAEHGEGLRVPARTFTSAFLLAVALCMAVVLAFSTLLIRRSLAPLERLKHAAQRLGHGRYETRVEINSGDEFEELAGAFNGMAGRLVDQIGELQDLHVGTIRALARAIDASSHWTRGHSERVAQLSVAIAGVMGHPQEDLDLIYRGGLLHDVGKIGVPGHVLDKDGKLTAEEFELIKAHPVIGTRILEPVTQLGPLLPMVRSHHERVDGQGYPDGLTGEEMHPFARIMAVADVWDAITSDRPYRDAMPFEKAWEIITLGAGTHFDPPAVAAFESLAREFYRRPAKAHFDPAAYVREPVREAQEAVPV